MNAGLCRQWGASGLITLMLLLVPAMRPGADAMPVWPRTLAASSSPMRGAVAMPLAIARERADQRSAPTVPLAPASGPNRAFIPWVVKQPLPAVEPVFGTLAAGGGHTCALTAAGGLKCWGDNFVGQLGDGTHTSRATPVDVPGFDEPVVWVDAGDYHTCAVTAKGKALCWGLNEYNELGDGSSQAQSRPVAVDGLESRVSAVAAGNNHTCALTAGDSVKCWGSQFLGQLGNGKFGLGSPPVDVLGLPAPVTTFAAGLGFSCALSSTGQVWCWGISANGQVGDGGEGGEACAVNVRCFSTPTAVRGLGSDLIAVVTGNTHACALTSAGGVQCWGDNTLNQMGDGGGGVPCGFSDLSTCRLQPLSVAGLEQGVVAIAAGAYHTCALLSTGGVTCWGWNTGGQLGDGTEVSPALPVSVTGLEGRAAAVTAGGSHTCALMEDGGIQCWGRNGYGQLGDGSTQSSLTPVAVIWTSE